MKPKNPKITAAGTMLWIKQLKRYRNQLDGKFVPYGNEKEQKIAQVIVNLINWIDMYEETK